MIDNFDKFVASSYSLILRNPNLTWETITNNLDKFREIIHIMSYPNITLEIIEENIDKDWDWTGICSNKMKVAKKEWINLRRLKHIKALQIQRHWRNCSCNPEFKLAQRCLLRLHGS